jgi:GTPase SAR1 family protein
MKKNFVFVGFVIAFILVTLGLVFASYNFFQRVLGLSDETYAVYLSIFSSALVYLATIFGFREHIESLYYRFVVSNKCRIFIVGGSGVGKSSLITAMLSGNQPYRYKSTKDFALFESVISLGLQDKLNPANTLGVFGIEKPIRVVTTIADHRGENPESIFTYSNVNFFGNLASSGSIINCILFVVDFFNAPETLGISLDDKEDFTQIDEEILVKYKDNVEKKIRERINEQYEIYMRPYIRLAFARAYNKERTYYIGIVVNKFDLLRETVLQGYLKIEGYGDEISSSTIRKYALDLIKPICQVAEQHLRERLSNESIFIHFVSAATGEGVNKMLGEILQVYQDKEDKRHGRQHRT